MDSRKHLKLLEPGNKAGKLHRDSESSVDIGEFEMRYLRECMVSHTLGREEKKMES